MAQLIDPVGRLLNVTPSNSVDIPGGLTSALYISVAGTLQVTDQTGNVVALPSVTDPLP